MGRRVVARAPGRVNLIGEHTDYQEGFALPVATDLGLTVTVEERPRDGIRVRSRAYGEAVEVPRDEALEEPFPAWARLPVAALREYGPAGGIELSIDGDLPVGAGLASSGALLVATSLAAAALAGRPVPVEERPELARRCRELEAEATGVCCGLLDPYTALLAEEGTALLLDCREETHRNVRVDPERVAIVIIDSGIRHDLAAGDYNRRRRECEEAVSLLGDIRSLRDLEDVPDLPPLLLRRVRHVVGENRRTLEAAGALAAGDIEIFGSLLDESQRSLAEDYDVSCPEIDALVRRARRLDGVLGARMTGGGFGGFVVAAVRPEAVDRVVFELPARAVIPSGGAWVAVARHREV